MSMILGERGKLKSIKVSLKSHHSNLSKRLMPKLQNIEENDTRARIVLAEFVRQLEEGQVILNRHDQSELEIDLESESTISSSSKLNS